MNNPTENTDNVIFCSNSSPYKQLSMTKEGALAINVGGYVYVKTIEEWHKLAGGKFDFKSHEDDRMKPVKPSKVTKNKNRTNPRGK